MSDLLRIIFGPINERVKGPSDLIELGHASFMQSRWHYTDVFMRIGDEPKKKFRIKSKINNKMEREEFLRGIDGYLLKEHMYLAFASVHRDKIGSILGGMPYYKMSGSLYKEK